MLKAEVLTNLSVKTGRSKKECSEFLSALFDVLKDDLKQGESTNFIDFGTFRPNTKAARTTIIEL